MADGYTDTPYNMTEIDPYVIADKSAVVSEILRKEKCYFYDTCSFRRHANLRSDAAEYILRYIKIQNGVIIITRCILMELASCSGKLNPEYVKYIRRIRESGIQVLILYEEDLFSVMEVCFSTNAVINNYLCWAVRTMKLPVSTITKTLEENSNLYDEVIRGHNLENRKIYKSFFEAVRNKKESGDNLGEELLAICLHILSYIPGEPDGKFCVITDDKEAGSKIDMLFKQTAKHYKGRKIILFSTPKLVQVLYREHILEDKEYIKEILDTGTNGNIVVLGARIFDIRSMEISLDSEKLADLILQPNGIQIIF